MAVTLSISMSEGNINNAANTSDVTAIVYAHSTSGSYYSSPRPGYLVLDGTRYDFSSAFAANVTTELYRFTKTVVHESDGSKTAYANAWFSTGVSSGDITATKSLVLTNIPRNSIITAINETDDMERTFNVSFTKYANYLHNLRLYIGGTTIKTIYNIADSPRQVVLTDEEILSIMTAGEVGGGRRIIVKFDLTTYNNGVQIGSVSTVEQVITCNGNAAYDDGTNMKLGIPYYDTGTEWKCCIAKYDDGAVWK